MEALRGPAEAAPPTSTEANGGGGPDEGNTCGPSSHQLSLMSLGGPPGSSYLAQEVSSPLFQPALDALKLLNQNDKSFYIFRPHDAFRKACLVLTNAPAFGQVVLLLVFLNCITLAMDPGPCDEDCQHSDYMHALFIMETFFTACFTLEILCQALANCFLLGPAAYLHDGWNWIDLISTATGYIAFLPVGDGGGYDGLRALRALRPLRMLKVVPGLKRLIQCLLEVVPLLIDVLFLLVWVFFVFGIVALNIFMGTLHNRCAYQNTTAAFPSGPPPGSPGMPFGSPPLAPGPGPPVADSSSLGVFNSSSRNGSSGGAAGPVEWILIPGFEDTPCSSSGAVGAISCPADYEGLPVSCRGRYPNPNFGYTGFDNFGMASLNIFGVLTLDGWSELQLYPQWSAGGPGLPIAFFSLLVLFGSFFAMQLVVAIMSSKFAQLEAVARSQTPSRTNTIANLQQLDDDDDGGGDGVYGSVDGTSRSASSTLGRSPSGAVLLGLAARLGRGVRTLRRRYRLAGRALRAWMYDFRLRHMQPVHRVTLPPWRKLAYGVVENVVFQQLMTLCIVVNTVVLGMDHYGIGPTLARVINVTNNVLTYVFIAELVLKHVAIGFLRYWADPWNVLDGVVVGVSVAEIILVALGGGKTGTQALRTLRVLRVLRTLKLLRRVRSLHRLVKMVVRGFYALGNFLLLASLFIFIFSIMGLQQFGGMWSFQPEANLDDPEASRSSFNTLWQSGYTVFQILTCDDWLRVAWNGMRASGVAAVLYFVTWVVIGNFVLLSLFLAILITSFQTDDEDEAADDAESEGPQQGFTNGDGAQSSVATLDSQQQRRRGARYGGDAADGPDGPSAANALQQRVAERVSERLDPARVKIMKRWLVMIGVTHGMTEEEVSTIVKELDTRLTFDPDSLHIDSSFTTPHMLRRHSIPLALTRRGSTLRRSTVHELSHELPTMPEEQLSQRPSARRASAGTASLRRVAAAAAATAAVTGLAQGQGQGQGSCVVSAEDVWFYTRKESCGGAGPTAFETAAAAAAATAALGGSDPEGSSGPGSGGGGPHPVYSRVSVQSAGPLGGTSASGATNVVLPDRPSGGVAGMFERLAHAVRKLGAPISSDVLSPRVSAPGGSGRADAPPPTPRDTAGWRGTGPMDIPQHHVSYSGASASHWHAHGAARAPTRMGRSQMSPRQDSWSMLIPRTEALLRYQQHQQHKEDVWAQERLRTWLRDSRAVLGGTSKKHRPDSVDSASLVPYSNAHSLRRQGSVGMATMEGAALPVQEVPVRRGRSRRRMAGGSSRRMGEAAEASEPLQWGRPGAAAAAGGVGEVTALAAAGVLVSAGGGDDTIDDNDGFYPPHRRSSRAWPLPPGALRRCRSLPSGGSHSRMAAHDAMRAAPAVARATAAATMQPLPVLAAVAARLERDLRLGVLGSAASRARRRGVGADADADAELSSDTLRESVADVGEAKAAPTAPAQMMDDGGVDGVAGVPPRSAVGKVRRADELRSVRDNRLRIGGRVSRGRLFRQQPEVAAAGGADALVAAVAGEPASPGGPPPPPSPLAQSPSLRRIRPQPLVVPGSSHWPATPVDPATGGLRTNAPAIPAAAASAAAVIGSGSSGSGLRPSPPTGSVLPATANGSRRRAGAGALLRAASRPRTLPSSARTSNDQALALALSQEAARSSVMSTNDPVSSGRVSSLASPSSVVVSRMAAAMNHFTWGPASPLPEDDADSSKDSGGGGGGGSCVVGWSPEQVLGFALERRGTVDTEGGGGETLPPGLAFGLAELLEGRTGEGRGGGLGRSATKLGGRGVAQAAAAAAAGGRSERCRRAGSSNGSSNSSSRGGGGSNSVIDSGYDVLGSRLAHLATINPFYDHAFGEDDGVAASRGGGGAAATGPSSGVPRAFTDVYGNPLARQSHSTVSALDTLNAVPSFATGLFESSASAAASAAALTAEGSAVSAAAAAASAAGLAAEDSSASATAVAVAAEDPAASAEEAAAAAGTGLLVVNAGSPSATAVPALSPAAARASAYPAALPADLATAVAVAAAKSPPLGPQYDTWSVGLLSMEATMVESSGASGIQHGSLLLPPPPPPAGLKLAAAAASSPFTKSLSGRSVNNAAWRAPGSDEGYGVPAAAAAAAAVAVAPPPVASELMGNTHIPSKEASPLMHAKGQLLPDLPQAVSEPGRVRRLAAEIVGEQLVLQPSARSAPEVGPTAATQSDASPVATDPRVGGLAEVFSPLVSRASLPVVHAQQMHQQQRHDRSPRSPGPVAEGLEADDIRGGADGAWMAGGDQTGSTQRTELAQRLLRSLLRRSLRRVTAAGAADGGWAHPLDNGEDDDGCCSCGGGGRYGGGDAAVLWDQPDGGCSHSRGCCYSSRPGPLCESFIPSSSSAPEPLTGGDDGITPAPTPRTAPRPFVHAATAAAATAATHAAAAVALAAAAAAAAAGAAADSERNTSTRSSIRSTTARRNPHLQTTEAGSGAAAEQQPPASPRATGGRPTDRRPAAPRQLLHSASSRQAPTRLNSHTSFASSFLVSRYSGPGVSPAPNTAAWTPSNVAWARDHGPRDAIEMEQALYAPVPLATMSQRRDPRQSNSNLNVAGGDGGPFPARRTGSSSGRLARQLLGERLSGGCVASKLSIGRISIAGGDFDGGAHVAVDATGRDGGGRDGGGGRGTDGDDGDGNTMRKGSGGSQQGGSVAELGLESWGQVEDRAPYLAYPALCCISGQSPVRLLATAIILHRWFDNFILAVILASSAVLAVDSPRLDVSSSLGHAMVVMDIVFTAIFTFEMVIKLLAKGLVLHPHSYLRNGWDVLDGLIVLTSLVSLGLSGSGGTGALKSVRLVRTLRPLRLMRRLRGMRRVVETLIRSLPTLCEVLLFGVFQFTLFGILGVQLFAGKMSVCSQTSMDGTPVTRRSQCVEGVQYECGSADFCADPGVTAVRWWGPPMRNFDHLGAALLTLFTVATLDGYMEVAWSCVDAVGVDRVPEVNHAPYMGLFVIAFIFLGSFFWVNLLVSVIIDHYARIVAEEGDLLVTKQAKEYIRIFQFERNGKDIFKGGCPDKSSRLRRFCWKVASHPRFDTAVTANIVINILAMAAVYDGTLRAYDVALAMVNVACTCGFAVEAWFKIVALGFRKYIADNWNKLDLFIIAVSVPDIVSTFTPMSAATGIVTVLRLLRVFRMFKLIKNARGLRTLFNTLISSSPAIANVGSLLLLIMYIYAVIGMNMYGNYGSAFDQLGSHATYNNIGAAMATQFRLFTGDGWGDLMAVGMNCDDFQYQCDTGASALAAAVFFCSFVLVAIFIMLNLVIAVVVDNFIDNAQLEGLLKTSNFVDLLRMVITLRVFVMLMRHKIDTVRKHCRTSMLMSTTSNRLQASRRTRSRTNTLLSTSPTFHGVGGGVGSVGGGSGGGGGGGSSSQSGRASGDLLPRLVKVVSRMGVSNSGFGSLLSPDVPGGGGGSGSLSTAPPVQTSRSGGSSSHALLATIRPVLPRRQQSSLLVAAELAAQRASASSTDAAGGVDGGGAEAADRLTGSGAPCSPSGTRALAELRELVLRRRRRRSMLLAHMRRAKAGASGGDNDSTGGGGGGSSSHTQSSVSHGTSSVGGDSVSVPVVRAGGAAPVLPRAAGPSAAAAPSSTASAQPSSAVQLSVSEVGSGGSRSFSSSILSKWAGGGLIANEASEERRSQASSTALGPGPAAPLASLAPRPLLVGASSGDGGGGGGSLQQTTILVRRQSALSGPGMASVPLMPSRLGSMAAASGTDNVPAPGPGTGPGPMRSGSLNAGAAAAAMPHGGAGSGEVVRNHSDTAAGGSWSSSAGGR